MIKLITIQIWGLMMLTFFSSFFNFFDTRTPSTKMAHKIVKDVGKRMNSKYGLEFMGISEEGPDGKYIRIGFEFNYQRLVSKDQGRRLLLQVSQDVLKMINSYPNFKQYMANFPFNNDNIIINIYIQPQNGIDVNYSDIVLFSSHNNVLVFLSGNSKNNQSGYLVEEETYEEALRKAEFYN